MEYMETLKDLLCAELEDYAKKGKVSGKLSAGDLGLIDTMLHSIKNIMKIDVLKEEAEYSEAGEWMGEGKMYGTSYDGDYSGVRGRGRNARRDSMGRYSRESGESYARGGQGGSSYRREYSRDGGKEHIMEYVEEMMENAKNDKEREEYRRIKRQLEMI